VQGGEMQDDSASVSGGGGDGHRDGHSAGHSIGDGACSGDHGVDEEEDLLKTDRRPSVRNAPIDETTLRGIKMMDAKQSETAEKDLFKSGVGRTYVKAADLLKYAHVQDKEKKTLLRRKRNAGEAEAPRGSLLAQYAYAFPALKAHWKVPDGDISAALSRRCAWPVCRRRFSIARRRCSRAFTESAASRIAAMPLGVNIVRLTPLSG
jgi:hypothetical protein